MRYNGDIKNLIYALYSFMNLSQEDLASQVEKQIEKLNIQQQQAVRHKEGPLLVVAGAGSGKTRVATLRIAHLIGSGVAPESIVGVTFTNKAANEMKERILQLVGQAVVVSTFHSLGLRILRSHAEALGYSKDFTIYDADDSSKAMKTIAKELGVTEEQALKGAAFISSCKNRLLIPEDVVDENELGGKAVHFYRRYQEFLRHSHAVDFDDLLFLPVILFKLRPDILASYHQTWSYFLVDEYQDTNYAQSIFVSKLVGARENLFAVGDPDQSIYSWRGADISNILRFQVEYPKAKVVRLEENYRSADTILQAANAVIKNNKGRLEKVLWSKRTSDHKVQVYCAPTEREEAQFVAKSIRNLIGEGEAVEDIGVLFRTNAQSRALEDSLLEYKIPYAIYGGLSFYQRKEVKDILSLLRLARQPGDTIAFARAIQFPKRGLGDTSIAKLSEAARNTGRTIVEVAKDVVAKVFPISLNTKQLEGLNGFLQSLSAIQQAINNGVGPAVEAAAFDSGYMKALEQDQELFQEKSEIISELVAKAYEWDRAERGDVQKFLEEVALIGAGEQVQESTLSLMTIHNAKGLEFKIVFLIGLEEDILPHINSKKTGEGIEEERRLLYVAMTRAKERLILTCAETRLLWGGFRSMRPSQFLFEIPKDFLEPLSKQQRVFPKKTDVRSNTSSVSAEKLLQGKIVLHRSYGVGKIEKVVESSEGVVYHVYFAKDGSRHTFSSEEDALKPI